MTDFTKEARDLDLYREETGDLTSREMIDAALRRMHAAGVAEGMAKAAEIARPPVQMAVMALSAIKGTYDLHKNMRKDVQIALDGLRALLAASPPPEPQPQLTADQMSALEKAAYDKLPAQEDDGWRSEQEWQALLDGRDKFIVDQGLWRDFVRSL